jgi:mono/diheme cytochrome c family protein
VLALSTGQKLGLLLFAALFIGFALASSFLFPRYRPDFPGRGLRLFIAVTVILTIAMLGAVQVLAKEDEEEEPVAAETTAGETTAPEPTTEEQTTTGQTTTAPEETTTQAQGSAEAGRTIFIDQGCGSCHTFSAAGSSSEVGPNLDESLEGKDAAFVRESIVDPEAEVTEGYSPGIMPGDFGEKLDDEQLNDLVAFLTQ